MNLDKIDKKLITYLFHNFRETTSNISKKTKLSRDQINYRLNKYEKSGLFSKYCTLFNLPYFGFTNQYVIRLNICDSKQDIKIPNSENVLVFTKLKTFGDWNCIITIFTKSKKDLYRYIDELYTLFNNKIVDYSIYEPIEYSNYPFKVFDINTCEDNTISYHDILKNNYKMDSYDKQICDILANNADLKLVDIAQKINKNPDFVKYRIKNLEQRNIVLSYLIFLNLSKIDCHLSQVLVKTGNLHNYKDKIKEFARNNKNIHAHSCGIGEYNIIFQIVYYDYKE